MNLPLSSVPQLQQCPAGEVHSRLHLMLAARECGCSTATAAAAAGLDEAGFERCCEQDASLAVKVSLARRRGEARLVRKLARIVSKDARGPKDAKEAKEAKTDWRALAWLLERGFGGRWAGGRPGRGAAEKSKGEPEDRGHDDETRRHILERLGCDPGQLAGQPSGAAGGPG